MDALKLSARTRVAGLIVVGLVTLLLLSSCTNQPTVNVEATAQSLGSPNGRPNRGGTIGGAGSTSATDTPVAAAPTQQATEIPAAASTATPTVLPTPTVMPTRLPATTVATSPVPGLTPGPAAACPVAVDPQLAVGWDQAKLGCPTAKAASFGRPGSRSSAENVLAQRYSTGSTSCTGGMAGTGAASGTCLRARTRGNGMKVTRMGEV